jgi:broad specificity phosphatase PhoE
MAIVLVRHAQVEPDPGLHPALWPLSDAGRAAARRLARARGWAGVDQMYVSPELKAQETAQIIAGRNGINVTVVEDLREVERGAGSWIDDAYPGGYAGAVRDYFAAPERAVHGWEPAAVARRRVLDCVATLRAWEQDEPTPFAIVGHGLALSLAVATLTGAEPYDVWRSIALPDVAVLDADRGRLPRPFGRPAARAR